MTQHEPVGSCGRIALLLSLAADDAATPSQLAEIEAHSGCDACRRAGLVDAAARRRLVERADAPAPSWLAGFAQRTAARALEEAREARSQNRMLWMSAAAAVLAAIAVQFAVKPHRTTPDIHETTRLALLRTAHPQGK
jgi:hypothetical protein